MLLVLAALTLACGRATADNESEDSGAAAAGEQRGVERTAAESTVPSGAFERPPNAPVHAPAAVPAPRDRDQAFLRTMLDRYEAIIAVAHDRMMAPAGHDDHGAVSDPGTLDAALDLQKFEMLALLDTLYGERYSPHPAVLATGGPAGALAIEDSADARYRAQLVGQLRAGVELIDQSRPALRRARVRELARRVRETLVTQLRLAGEAPPRD